MTSRPRQVLTRVRTAGVLAILTALLLVSIVWSLSTGATDTSIQEVVGAIVTPSTSSTLHAILMEIRLPRILLALFVGAGLSVAGTVFQALLRNPLADPFILGVSSGATLGTLLATIVFAATAWLVPFFSFMGALIVTGVVFLAAHRHGHLDTHALLLSGVMAGAFINAIILALTAVMHQDVRHSFLWLLGNLGGARMDAVLISGTSTAMGATLIFAAARQYNLLSLGDEASLQLGVDVRRLKQMSYVAASLLTGVVVSFTGVIGFVGLIVPHSCRILLGPDHRLLLPASFLTGGIYLIITDTIGRTILAPTEIPVGVITALIGAPVFVFLLRRR